MMKIQYCLHIDIYDVKVFGLQYKMEEARSSTNFGQGLVVIFYIIYRGNGHTINVKTYKRENLLLFYQDFRQSYALSVTKT